jgi:hypothetical protein
MAHPAGLFSLINKVVTAAEIYDNVHVDFSKGTLYSPIGINLWDQLFEPTINRGGIILKDYLHYDYTGGREGRAALLYAPGNDNWRSVLNAVFSKFKIQDAIYASMTPSDYPQGPVVSVLVRSGPNDIEQPSGKHASFADYFKLINGVLADSPETTIYLVASDNEAVSAFTAEYGNKLLYDVRIRRGDTRSALFLEETPQYIEDAKHCLRVVILMSKAATLIHPVSNMATAALYMNPNSKSIFI